MKTLPLSFFCCCFLLFLGDVCPAQAHKVNIFAYIDGTTIYAESYFSDGKPVAGATVALMDRSKQILLRGTTDRQGLLTFPLPPTREPLILVIDAGMGHRNQFTLKQETME